MGLKYILKGIDTNQVWFYLRADTCLKYILKGIDTRPPALVATALDVFEIYP